MNSSYSCDEFRFSSNNVFTYRNPIGPVQVIHEPHARPVMHFSKIRHYQFKNKNASHDFFFFSFVRMQMFWSDSSEEGPEPVWGSIFALRVMSFKQTDAVGLYMTECHCHMSLSASLAPAVSSQQQHSTTLCEMVAFPTLMQGEKLKNKSNLLKGEASVCINLRLDWKSWILNFWNFIVLFRNHLPI